jgi:phospholipid/cholesterol/gamma-HCH transport system permease protein
VRTGTNIDDVVAGLIKPLVFGLLIALISCHKGLSTTGGTVGVGVSTTKAVVLSSISIIVADFFLSRALQSAFSGTFF